MARAAHVIADIDYRSPVPRTEAPTTCSCGWEGTAAAFEEHRRTAPREGQDMARTGPTEKQQEAWDLVSRDGLSQVDAADRLGITQAGVQSRLRGYMEAMGLPGPIPGYGGGNGPISFRRVAPEVLDVTPTTSATVELDPPAVAVQDDADSSSETVPSASAALPGAEGTTTVPDHPRVEDRTVEAPEAPGGSSRGASTVIPWPASADHEVLDVLDVLIREHDRLTGELLRLEERMEELRQHHERTTLMHQAIADARRAYGESVMAAEVMA